MALGWEKHTKEEQVGRNSQTLSQDGPTLGRMVHDPFMTTGWADLEVIGGDVMITTNYFCILRC